MDNEVSSSVDPMDPVETSDLSENQISENFDALPICEKFSNESVMTNKDINNTKSIDNIQLKVANTEKGTINISTLNKETSNYFEIQANLDLIDAYDGNHMNMLRNGNSNNHTLSNLELLIKKDFPNDEINQCIPVKQDRSDDLLIVEPITGILDFTFEEMARVVEPTLILTNTILNENKLNIFSKTKSETNYEILNNLESECQILVPSVENPDRVSHYEENNIKEPEQYLQPYNKNKHSDKHINNNDSPRINLNITNLKEDHDETQICKLFNVENSEDTSHCKNMNSLDHKYILKSEEKIQEIDSSTYDKNIIEQKDMQSLEIRDDSFEFLTNKLSLLEYNEAMKIMASNLNKKIDKNTNSHWDSGQHLKYDKNIYNASNDEFIARKSSNYRNSIYDSSSANNSDDDNEEHITYETKNSNTLRKKSVDYDDEKFSTIIVSDPCMNVLLSKLNGLKYDTNSVERYPRIDNDDVIHMGTLGKIHDIDNFYDEEYWSKVEVMMKYKDDFVINNNEKNVNAIEPDEEFVALHKLTEEIITKELGNEIINKSETRVVKRIIDETSKEQLDFEDNLNIIQNEIDSKNIDTIEPVKENVNFHKLTEEIITKEFGNKIANNFKLKEIDETSAEKLNIENDLNIIQHDIDFENNKFIETDVSKTFRPDSDIHYEIDIKNREDGDFLDQSYNITWATPYISENNELSNSEKNLKFHLNNKNKMHTHFEQKFQQFNALQPESNLNKSQNISLKNEIKDRQNIKSFNNSETNYFNQNIDTFTNNVILKEACTKKKHLQKFKLPLFYDVASDEEILEEELFTNKLLEKYYTTDQCAFRNYSKDVKKYNLPQNKQSDFTMNSYFELDDRSENNMSFDFIENSINPSNGKLYSKENFNFYINDRYDNNSEKLTRWKNYYESYDLKLECDPNLSSNKNNFDYLESNIEFNKMIQNESFKQLDLQYNNLEDFQYLLKYNNFSTNKLVERSKDYLDIEPQMQHIKQESEFEYYNIESIPPHSRQSSCFSNINHSTSNKYDPVLNKYNPLNDGLSKISNKANNSDALYIDNNYNRDFNEQKLQLSKVKCGLSEKQEFNHRSILKSKNDKQPISTNLDLQGLKSYQQRFSKKAAASWKREMAEIFEALDLSHEFPLTKDSLINKKEFRHRKNNNLLNENLAMWRQLRNCYNRQLEDLKQTQRTLKLVNHLNRKISTLEY